jgi:hypothetical protein
MGIGGREASFCDEIHELWMNRGKGCPKKTTLDLGRSGAREKWTDEAATESEWEVVAMVLPLS